MLNLFTKYGIPIHFFNHYGYYNGFIDTFRHFYKDAENIYSWWSYRFNARNRNAGWRIDYFLASNDLKENLKDAKIHCDIYGSDHCPVELDIEI